MDVDAAQNVKTIMEDGTTVGMLPLQDDCHHYYHLSEIPWDIQKYWQQRHSIFSAYDDGVYMTDDAWFGVTPEPIALKIAEDMGKSIPQHIDTVIDIFAGAGGNSIAFALAGSWKHVICIERNASVLACAQRNAIIYGVADKITWVNDDSFSYVRRLYPDGNSGKTTTIFASPPWGGPGYSTDPIFDLNTMQPYNLADIYELCARFGVALFLPRSSDLRQIARLAGDGEKIEVVQYCIQGASKALVAYIPASAK